MGSIWEFIDKPEHFGAKVSAEKDFLYGLDRNRNTITKRCEDRLEEIRTSPKRATAIVRMEKALLEKDLKLLAKSGTPGETILHAFLEIGTDVPLGRANRFDRFLWDLYLRTGTKHFQVLTMFTNDIQANYFLLWKHPPFRLYRFFCSFFEVSSRKIKERDENFLLKAGALADPTDLLGKEKSDAAKILRNAKKQDLSTLLNWNQFSVDPPSGPTSSLATCIRFKRRFLMLKHSCREYFQNVPLITRSLDPSNVSALFSSFEETANYDANYHACLNSAKAFYNALGRQSWVAGVGAPMKQNLDQLGSAMSNYEASVTLVSGLPGTGKENYMNALHFAGTSCDPGMGSRLVKTTALAMEQHPAGVAAYFKEQCSHFSEPITFVIDELNKAQERTRSELLRVLENTKETLEKDLKVRFIMAASDHLDQLARDPPQDFWTRITNQMRVAHPLGRVSEEDAEAFLTAFFWFNWWQLTRDWLGSQDGEEKDAIALDLLRGGVREPHLHGTLARLVFHEFVDTVTPIAIRDEISVRGVRSMMQQIFFSVIWSTRYGLVPVRHADRGTEAITRRAVNHAIQDVLAILNSARSTPRTSAARSTPRTASS